MDLDLEDEVDHVTITNPKPKNPEPKQKSKLPLAKTCYLHEHSILNQPYFPDLIRSINVAGGLNLQDERFFTVEDILKFCDRIYYIGDVSNRKNCFDEFTKNYEIFGKFVDKVENKSVEDVLGMI